MCEKTMNKFNTWLIETLKNEPDKFSFRSARTPFNSLKL
jgi:hypothetical protein